MQNPVTQNPNALTMSNILTGAAMLTLSSDGGKMTGFALTAGNQPDVSVVVMNGSSGQTAPAQNAVELAREQVLAQDLERNLKPSNMPTDPQITINSGPSMRGGPGR